MKLSCERVREVLWPLDRPRRHVPDEEYARDHLTRCDACRGFFLRDAEVARLLRRIGEGIAVTPTPGLRMAVARALAEPRGSAGVPDGPAAVIEVPVRRRRFTGWRAEVSAVAIGLLLFAGGQVIASRYGGGPDAGRFAADYVRTAAVDFAQPGLEIRQIADFYERQLGRHIEPVALHQAPVTRATVCDLRGDLGSMIEYDLGGTRLVHYRIPLDSSRGRPPGSGGVRIDSRSGVQVAHWTDGEFEQALVSEASADYLRWLAENRFSRTPRVTNYGSPASRSWRRVAARP